jgi:glycine reductase
VVTNLVTIAEQVGAPRIVPGRGIQYPSGDPNLSSQAEHEWRRRLVARAMAAVTAPVDKPTIFEVDVEAGVDA